MISNQDKKNELKWFKLWKQWRNGIFVKYYGQVYVLSIFFVWLFRLQIGTEWLLRVNVTTIISSTMSIWLLYGSSISEPNPPEPGWTRLEPDP